MHYFPLPSYCNPFHAQNHISQISKVSTELKKKPPEIMTFKLSMNKTLSKIKTNPSNLQNKVFELPTTIIMYSSQVTLLNNPPTTECYIDNTSLTHTLLLHNGRANLLYEIYTNHTKTLSIRDKIVSLINNNLVPQTKNLRRKPVILSS